MKTVFIFLLFSSLSFANGWMFRTGDQFYFTRQLILNPGINGDFNNNPEFTSAREANLLPICGFVRPNQSLNSKIFIPLGAELVITHKTHSCWSFEGRFTYYCGEAEVEGYIDDVLQNIPLQINCQHGVFADSFFGKRK